MAGISGIQRRLQDLDREKVGRALLEYGGIPLALFMAIGIVVNFARGYGYYYPFIDPIQNLPLYFVVNFWVVIAVYTYRQRFQQALLFERRNELLLAAVPALTGVAIILYLLAGYVFFMLAIFQKDSLHTSFLPDLDEVTPDEEEDDAWGHLESVKGNMT